MSVHVETSASATDHFVIDYSVLCWRGYLHVFPRDVTVLQVIEAYMDRHGSGELQQVLTPAQRAYCNTYGDEINLNRRLNMFAVHFSQAYRGPNTTQEQMDFPSKRGILYTERSKVTVHSSIVHPCL